jgi:two-component system, NarL family, nitrate/nitrite response regulator NarL
VETIKPMRVLLVDDHALFRKGVASLLTALDDMEVVGEAASGKEALAKAKELTPDLVLMDIKMPDGSGLEATQRIKEAVPEAKIVMLTVSGEDGDLFRAIKSGAHGYLLKDIDPEELIKMLRGVHRGEAPISHLSAARILEEFARLAENETWTAGSEEVLTLREREVLELVAEGATNKEIADRLFIAENTVKNHLRNILTKLHLHSRVEAVAYALRSGLIGDAPAEN